LWKICIRNWINKIVIKFYWNSFSCRKSHQLLYDTYILVLHLTKQIIPRVDVKTLKFDHKILFFLIASLISVNHIIQLKEEEKKTITRSTKRQHLKNVIWNDRNYMTCCFMGWNILFHLTQLFLWFLIFYWVWKCTQ